jgi:predicted ArsR family transcriptional regulator
MVAAERRTAEPTDRAEARQLEDRLGLTPKAMRMLLWEVVADEVADQRQAAPGARGRIKAV